MAGLNDSSLVLYLPLNEMGGGTAHDFSGNKLNGELINNPIWTADAGKKGLKFNGTNQYIQINKNPHTNPNGIAVSCWVRFNSSATTTQPIIRTTQFASPLFWGLDVSSGNLRFFIYSGLLPKIASYSWVFQTNVWYFLTGIYNGSKVLLYINGVQMAETSFVGNIDIGNNFIDLGRNAASHLNGNISSVKVYNRALSPAEIQTLYSQGQAKIICPTNQGLVGYWPGIEGEGDILHDFSGNNNHGSLVNSPAWVSDSGKKGLKFNGDANVQRVVINQNTKLKPANALTICAWIKQSSIQGNAINKTIISTGSPGTNGYFFHTRFVTSGVRLRFFVGNVGITSLVDNVRLNEMLFYVGTWDGSVIRIYKNGSLVTQGNQSTLTYDSGNIFLGWDGIGTNNYFDGLISDVRLYGRALSPAEIQTLYYSGLTKITTTI